MHPQPFGLEVFSTIASFLAKAGTRAPHQVEEGSIQLTNHESLFVSMSSSSNTWRRLNSGSGYGSWERISNVSPARPAEKKTCAQKRKNRSATSKYSLKTGAAKSARTTAYFQAKDPTF